MNRRNAIRNIVFVSGGAVLLPSCLQQSDAGIPLKNMTLSGAQQEMLAGLSDAIIPKTNFIGAADLKAHEFVLTMVDDCYPPEEQQQFVKGLAEFDRLANEKYGDSFIACKAAEKKE